LKISSFFRKYVSIESTHRTALKIIKIK